MEEVNWVKKIIIVLLSTMVFITACSNTKNDNKEEINNKDTSTNTAQELENKVEFRISSNTYASNFGRGVLNELPSYDPNGEDYWQIDLRGYNVSELNLIIYYIQILILKQSGEKSFQKISIQMKSWEIEKIQDFR